MEKIKDVHLLMIDVLMKIMKSILILKMNFMIQLIQIMELMQVVLVVDKVELIMHGGCGAVYLNIINILIIQSMVVGHPLIFALFL